jgi:hypothetical protein
MKRIHPNILSASRLNNKKSHDLAVAKYMAYPKTCRECTGVIPIIKRVADARNKSFCSRSCSATFYNRGRIKTKAQKISRHQLYIDSWLSGDISGNTRSGGGAVSSHIKRWLRERCGNKCEKCSWSEINPKTGLVPLQVNHKNGDSDNSSSQNLEIICPNCHSLTVNYGALNKGHGRKIRREKRAGVAQLAER